MYLDFCYQKTSHTLACEYCGPHTREEFIKVLRRIGRIAEGLFAERVVFDATKSAGSLSHQDKVLLAHQTVRIWPKHIRLCVSLNPDQLSEDYVWERITHRHGLRTSTFLKFEHSCIHLTYPQKSRFPVPSCCSARALAN